MLVMLITSKFPFWIMVILACAANCTFSCNWLGGEAVSNEVDAKGFDRAGYTNITTSDHIVHGQVKQAGEFSK
jgi:carboxypeptidase D